MVVLNYTGGEVNAKIVYYGPGLSGKTTNLEFIHDRTPEGSRGKMVSMKTQTDRTLFFDFLPLELGEINGYRTRFLLYTVPGQVYYNATRKLVLKGVDAVVFVADSSRAKLDENLESLRNLEQNLNEHGMSLDEIPWVIQYNKRDVGDAMAVRDLDARLNPLRVPSYEAVATVGNGVYETFHGIATLVYRVLKERLERGDLAAASPAAPAVRPDARPAAPGGEMELEFDNAIDSMLREVEAPAPRPAPQVAPVPRVAPPAPAPFNVQSTVKHPGPARPAAAPVPPPVPFTAPGATPPGTRRTPVFAGVAHEPVSPRADAALEPERDPFDHELGRLPALDDAVAASDQAREDGPHEFVTDPMRRPLSAPPAPAAAPAPAAPVTFPRTDSAPAVDTVVVPVLLTPEQIRSGQPVRVLLDIRVKSE